MALDQNLYIPFLGGWTSIYQLFWCSPGVQGFDTLPYIYIYDSDNMWTSVKQALRPKRWVSRLSFQAPVPEEDDSAGRDHEPRL